MSKAFWAAARALGKDFDRGDEAVKAEERVSIANPAWAAPKEGFYLRSFSKQMNCPVKAFFSLAIPVVLPLKINVVCFQSPLDLASA